MFFFWTWLREFFPKNMSHRIEPFFSTWLNDFVSFDSKNRTFFFCERLKELNPFLFDVTERIEFLNNDSKNWTLLKIRFTLRELFKNMTHSENSTLLLNLFIWLKELLFYGSKNWTHFTNEWLNELIYPFWKYDSKNLTSFSRIRLNELNLFSWIWCKELSLFFSQYDSKNWILFLNMSQWIEPFFRWLKELNFFSIRLKD